tara:strand:- start:684 stop:929 length:246 start_codon:yes stop_codon:yes gene_type:complete
VIRLKARVVACLVNGFKAVVNSDNAVTDGVPTIAQVADDVDHITEGDVDDEGVVSEYFDEAVLHEGHLVLEFLQAFALLWP